jgi:hypothetical protein
VAENGGGPDFILWCSNGRTLVAVSRGDGHHSAAFRTAAVQRGLIVEDIPTALA